jgi:hypothetical protein
MTDKVKTIPNVEGWIKLLGLEKAEESRTDRDHAWVDIMKAMEEPPITDVYTMTGRKRVEALRKEDV